MKAKATKADPREAAERSIELVDQVRDVEGKLRRRLFESEAQWELGAELVAWGGGPPPAILAPGQAPPQGGLMPLPVWRITNWAQDRQRAVQLIVPFGGARVRVPAKLVVSVAADGSRNATLTA